MRKKVIAQKVESLPFTAKEIRKGFVSVSIDKSQSNSILSDMHLALAWALKQAGVTNVDITFRESDDRVEVVVEV